MPSATPNPALDIGDLSRTYAVVREIGRGGMGTVVLARHRTAQHRVAIKIASGEKFGAEAMARFAREAQLMARLRHPNIVGLYDITRIGAGRVGIVMEYVPGQSLARMLEQRELLPIEASLRIIRDVGRALVHAHSLGVIHRDVKPQNVLVEDGTGAAKLADFGIAKEIGDASDMTATGVALGTPAYMSPEQIDGGVVDVRSDVYSLGLLAWHLMSGRRPWEGEPLFTLLYKQKHEPLPALRALRAEVPPGLELALEGALAKEPAARWETVSAMLEQLDRDRPTSAMRARRQREAARQRPSAAQATAHDATIPLHRPLAPESAPAPAARRRASSGPGDIHAATVPVRRGTPPPSGEDALIAMDTAARSAGQAPGSVADSAALPTPGAWRSPVSVWWPSVGRSLPWRSFGSGLVVGAVGALSIFLGLGRTSSSGDRSLGPDTLVSPATTAASSVPASPAATLPEATRPAAAPRSVASLGAASADESVVATGPVSAIDATRRAASNLLARSEGNDAGLPSAKARSDALTRAARAQLRAVDLAKPSRVLQLVDSATRLDPRNGAAYLVRARLLASRGRVRDAWTDVEMGARTGAPWEAIALATAIRVSESGRAAARSHLEPAVSSARAAGERLDALRAAWLAAALAHVGERAQALDMLERADTSDPRLAPVLADPLFAPIASSPRFQRVRQLASP